MKKNIIGFRLNIFLQYSNQTKFSTANKLLDIFQFQKVKIYPSPLVELCSEIQKYKHLLFGN